MTEYTVHPGETRRDVLIGEIEASSHEEAYRLFIQRNPSKATQSVVVKDETFSFEFGGN
jgi:hypothetical protein